MTLSTLRPNTIIFNTGATTGGTADAILADDSDVTFITFDPSEDVAVGLTNLTLPVGALIANVTARARMSSAACLANIFVDMPEPDDEFMSIDQFVTVNLTSPTTYQSNSSTGPHSDAGMDTADMTVTNSGAAGQLLVLYALYLDVRHVAKPVVVVNAPTGTVTNTNLPTIVWTNTLDADGGAAADVEAKLFTAAQYGAGGFNPSTSTPTDSNLGLNVQTSWELTTVLPNATYRAYVRVAQTVNNQSHWSDWAFSQFTINVALPAVPSMTLTAENTSGRVKIELADVAGAATTDRLELQRSIDGGATWQSVRNNTRDDGLYEGTDVTIYDYEAPNGAAMSYRSRAFHLYTSVYAASAWGTATVMWTARDWWLKDPIVPALNVKLSRAMVSYGNVERQARHGVFQALGAALPIVVSDTRLGQTGTIILELLSAGERADLDALLDETRTMLLQGPVAEGQPDRYVRIGDHSRVRVVDKSWALATHETLPWTEVARPAGAITGPEWS